MEILVPPNCSSSDKISQSIHIFLKEQQNQIPIDIRSPSSTVDSASLKKTGGGFVDFISSFVYRKDTNKKTEQQISQKNTETLQTLFTNKTTEDKPISSTKDISIDVDTMDSNSNSIWLDITTNNPDPISAIKGTKLYYLHSRNGDCARWI